MERVHNAIFDRTFQKDSNGYKTDSKGHLIPKEGASMKWASHRSNQAQTAWSNVKKNMGRVGEARGFTSRDWNDYAFSPAERRGLQTALGGGK